MFACPFPSPLVELWQAWKVSPFQMYLPLWFAVSPHADTENFAVNNCDQFWEKPPQPGLPHVSPADSLMCQEQRHQVSEWFQVVSSNNKQHIPHHFALVDFEKSLPKALLGCGFNVSAYQTVLRNTVLSPAQPLAYLVKSLDAFSTLNIQRTCNTAQEEEGNSSAWAAWVSPPSKSG